MTQSPQRGDDQVSSASEPPLVSLVIPVYNQLDYTKQCLASIARWTDSPHEVIVVDNASTDGTRAYLQQAPVTLIANEQNVGCARAWNQGIRASRGRLIGILNNDIVLTRGWLQGLQRYMDETGHSVVSPAAREGRLDYDLEAYAQAYTRRCASASRSDLYGACFLVARPVFDRIGLFDEAFGYGGCEDVDFHWRVRDAGFTVGQTGSVLIHHFSMVTQTSLVKVEKKSYAEANLRHFTAKWGRTVRGNWIQRRWTGQFERWRDRWERLRYGHRLVERVRSAEPTPAAGS